MAYAYGYVAQIPEGPSEPFQLCGARQTGMVCGPVLIFVGGAGALMVGFFETRSAVIWPIITLGIILCATGVLLARRHVRVWREAEQERQRAIWRPLHEEYRGTGGGGNGASAFDLPMYCLEAPSLPANRQRPTVNGAAGGGGPMPSPFSTYRDAETERGAYWFALGVPLRPDDVSGGQYLYWGSLALVLQPSYKFTHTGGSAANDDSAVSCSRVGDCGADGGPEAKSNGSAPLSSAPSLTLLQTESAGLRLGGRSSSGAVGVGVAAGGGMRSGGPSRSGVVGELLSSLFVTIGGGGGGARGAGVGGRGGEGGGTSAPRTELAAAASIGVGSGAETGGRVSGIAKAGGLLRARSLPVPVAAARTGAVKHAADLEAGRSALGHRSIGRSTGGNVASGAECGGSGDGGGGGGEGTNSSTPDGAGSDSVHAGSSAAGDEAGWPNAHKLTLNLPV